MKDSAVGRIVGVLVAPMETFRSIAARPTWLPPLLLLVALGIGVSTLLVQHMDFDQTVRAQMARSGAQLTEEQMTQAVERGKAVAPWISAFQAVLTPLLYLLIALAFWAGLRMVGSEISYKTTFATTLHGLIPNALAALMAIPVIFQHGVYTQHEVSRGTFLASNLAAFAPAETAAPLVALLGTVDVFSLWSLILLIIGFRETAKVSRGAAIGTVLTLWLVYVTCKVALAAIFPT